MSWFIIFSVGAFVGAAVTFYAMMRIRKEKKILTTDDAIALLNSKGYYVNLNSYGNKQKNEGTRSN